MTFCLLPEVVEGKHLLTFQLGTPQIFLGTALSYRSFSTPLAVISCKSITKAFRSFYSLEKLKFGQ